MKLLNFVSTYEWNFHLGSLKKKGIIQLFFKGIVFVECILLYLCFLFFRWNVCPQNFLIQLEMHYFVTRNEGWWLLWEYGRRRHEDACSKNIKKWTITHIMAGQFLLLVTKYWGKNIKTLNRDTFYEFIWTNIHYLI